MHSSETPLPTPATGPHLLYQLGRLMVRARSPQGTTTKPPEDQRDRLLQAKLLAAKALLPGGSKSRTDHENLVLTQPKLDADRSPLDVQLDNHVQALWNEKIPICIEVLLAPDCQECLSSLLKMESSSYDKSHGQDRRGLLLERWTLAAIKSKNNETPSFITSQWLINAVRSQLHFSQLAAWLATLTAKTDGKVTVNEDSSERRRKLSRETCNIKKLESNCDERDLPTNEEPKNNRILNIIYSIKTPTDTYKMSEFSRTPIEHTFPITDIGQNVYLKVILESLPRLESIPNVKCNCQTPKRRLSKDMSAMSANEDITSKMNDLNLGPPERCKRSQMNSNVNAIDDRMLTPCSVSGKHKCNCDDESDQGRKSSITKKLDERRLKEIAKYKRRLRKESKLSKMRDSSESTTSEGDGLNGQKTKEPHTSIPILQASRFDRFRAIGCYRNQTYLTLPASRIECKSPFATENYNIPEYKKTNTVGTQTDELACDCGKDVSLKCDDCNKKMVRSEAIYNIASLTDEKRNCDTIYNINNINNINTCDNNSFKQSGVRKCPEDYNDTNIIKRPKLKRIIPKMNKIDKILNERKQAKETCKDMEVLHLNNDDSVFEEMTAKSEPKTPEDKTFSDLESPRESLSDYKEDLIDSSEFQVPSPTETDRFRYRFDSAASMIFNRKTGLPLTSSPAPLKRGNHCFDYDDSINGVSGIKSALFHPIPTTRPPMSPRHKTPRRPKPAPLKLSPSGGLLGSFEESVLKGRLEAVSTVHGFTATLAACGAECPPQRRLPVTVFFYAPGPTNAPYMGHINLGSSGYKVPRAGTIQVSLFNPHGTLVKLFRVEYSLRDMPAAARTFLRQRTLYLPAGSDAPAGRAADRLRYLIHLRFMTSKSGTLYLHTDIRIIVSRKSDVDTASAHSAILNPPSTNKSEGEAATSSNMAATDGTASNKPCRVFGGCSDGDFEICYENPNGQAYELRSFTYGPDNPKYSPR